MKVTRRKPHHHQRDGNDRNDLEQIYHSRAGPVGRKVLLVHAALHRFHHHDRVVHHDPDRQHQRELIRLIDRPMILLEKKAPISDTGTAGMGMIVEHQSPRNRNTTRATNPNASISVVQHLLDRGIEEARHVIAKLQNPCPEETEDDF